MKSTVLLAYRRLAAPMAVLLMGAWGCQGEEGSKGRPPQRQNLILIGVDTLRADHLSLYGYSRPTSPRLDAYARDAVVFERCITPIPRTTAAVASLMTGQYPARHGARRLWEDLAPGASTLATLLRDEGYQTLRISGTGMLNGKVEHGFDIVDNTNVERQAGELTDLAIAALSQVEGPYFLFVFYRDPHIPYDPPRVVFDTGYVGRYERALWYDGDKGKMVFDNDLDEPTRHHAVALYDSEIRYADEHIGRLLAEISLRDPGALVIFTADHGESLGEWNYHYDHGDVLNQASLHVPLIAKGLRVAPQRVSKVVRLIDVMPTALAQLGVEYDASRIDGIDLVSLIEDEALEVTAISESGYPLLDEALESGIRLDRTLKSRHRSIVSGDSKLLYLPRRSGPEYWLYDLAKDPEEGQSWPKGSTPELRRLRRQLDQWVARDLERIGRPAPAEPTPADAERLRALGYLEAEAGESAGPAESREAPASPESP